jgi:hypothetical protein
LYYILIPELTCSSPCLVPHWATFQCLTC